MEDNGAGIGETANLFVPFFTTKPNGSGIGLVLCQQIAENHGGSLALYNRDDRSGCIAILRLPLPKPPAPTLMEPPSRPDAPWRSEASESRFPNMGLGFPGTGVNPPIFPSYYVC